MRRHTGNCYVNFPAFDAVFLPLDLNMSSSVTEAANRLKGVRLAGIINNAGTMERHFSLSADFGPETTMNVNYHNTRLLNQLLLPQIARRFGCVHHLSHQKKMGYNDTFRLLLQRNRSGSCGHIRFQGMDNPFRSQFASEGKKCGVRVNCADPGVVDSSMIRITAGSILSPTLSSDR